MSIACTTCFKVEREEAMLLKINIFTTCFSAIGSLLGGYVFNSIWFIIGTVVVAIILRSVISESVLAGRLSVDRSLAITVGELVITLVFIFIASLVNNGAVAFVAYGVVYVTYLALNRVYCNEVLLKFRRVISPTPKHKPAHMR